VQEVRRAAIYALGERGDPQAADAIEALVRGGELFDTAQSEAESVVRVLRNPEDLSQQRAPGPPPPAPAAASRDATNPEVRAALERLEREIKELKDRVKKLEEKLKVQKE
jgi:hypothetical protein